MYQARHNFSRKISQEDLDTWPAPESLALDEKLRLDYERKRSAISRYASGASLKSIESDTGISRQHLYSLIERCQFQNEDGRPIGFLALVKGKHLPKPRRSSPEKLTAGRSLPGALQGLFARHPQLRQTMFDLIVHGRTPDSKRKHHRLTWPIIHDIFEEQCEKLGISPPNYPFCSESTGFAALVRWGKRAREIQVRQKEYLDFAEQERNQSRSLASPSQCYQRVQCDGHYVDLNWIVEVPGLKGEGVIRIKVSRLWLIALLEEKSTAVIGYSVALGKNYSAADIARAVRSSIVPWKPRDLSVSTITYKPGECLPNALDPRLSYVCYDQICLDNAKSHLSELFLTVLERTVNAVPVFGPHKAPNVRPHIEMLFDLLEEAGIHPLDGTTGSNPKDPRRSTSKDDGYLLDINTVFDLIDLLIVRYNTGIAPGTTISRLEVLRRAVNRETTVFRRIPEALREMCFKYDLYEVATIGVERGRPVLRWRDARYFGAGLLSQAGLIGQEVLVMANSNDLRLIEIALTKNGQSLGILEVEPRWRSTAHTLWARKQVRRTMTNSSFMRHAADIPRAMRAHAEKEARKGSRNKLQLAKLALEQNAVAKNGGEGMDSDLPLCAEPISLTGQSSTQISSGEKDINSATYLEDLGDDEFEEILRRLGSVYR